MPFEFPNSQGLVTCDQPDNETTCDHYCQRTQADPGVADPAYFDFCRHDLGSELPRCRVELVKLKRSSERPQRHAIGDDW